MLPENVLLQIIPGDIIKDFSISWEDFTQPVTIMVKVNEAS